MRGSVSDAGEAVFPPVDHSKVVGHQQPVLPMSVCLRLVTALPLVGLPQSLQPLLLLHTHVPPFSHTTGGQLSLRQSCCTSCPTGPSQDPQSWETLISVPRWAPLTQKRCKHSWRLWLQGRCMDWCAGLTCTFVRKSQSHQVRLGAAAAAVAPYQCCWLITASVDLKLVQCQLW